MSQFQQPNRRPAPGVVDLGTGRQAEMEQRNLSAGAFGSRGVMGGESLQVLIPHAELTQSILFRTCCSLLQRAQKTMSPIRIWETERRSGKRD